MVLKTPLGPILSLFLLLLQLQQRHPPRKRAITTNPPAYYKNIVNNKRLSFPSWMWYKSIRTRCSCVR